MPATLININGHAVRTAGYGVTFHELAVVLPDLPNYADAGLLPTSPELSAAIARHTELVNGYRAATLDRDEAAAILRNTRSGGQAISAAITNGTDPGEAADAAEAARAKATRDVDRAKDVLAAFATPIAKSAWIVYGLVEQYAPDALEHLAPHISDQEAAVLKARAALAKVEARLLESIRLAGWIDGTHQIPNAQFPSTLGLALFSID